MDVYLIVIGRKALTRPGFDYGRFITLLGDRNYVVSKIIFADDGESVVVPASPESERLIVLTGDISAFVGSLTGGEEYVDIIKKDRDIYVPMPVLDENLVRETIIPLLNSRCRTSSNTVIFKTFGKTESELREILSDCMKGRSRISFAFLEHGQECDVRITYAKSVPSAIINDVVNRTGAALENCVYAYKDISLAKSVARRLMASGKKLAIAESFTGGGLAAALIASPGMSNSLIESLVCYSNESKISRLGVPASTIEKSGAVSPDTAFEMANGLLSNPRADIVVATTGNAGPTAEKDGQVGLFYIAIGDRSAIHVFEQYYQTKDPDTKSVDDIRQEITEAGINTALFELGRYLNKR